MCESHQLQRNTAKVWKFTEKPHLQIRFWPFKPFRNDESPKRFLKLNYRTEFPCKNNHNTDHCLPDGMSNASAQQIIFSTYHDFQTYFDTKNAYLPFETSTISSLDITLAATRKKKLVWFSWWAQKKDWETTNYYQHESNNRVRHCSGRDADIVTYMYQCSTLHIRGKFLIGSLKKPSIGSELIASRW